MSTASLTTAEITKKSRSNFALSFAFMSRERQRGMAAVYSFCRAVDDAVDEAPDTVTGRERLDAWRAELDAAMSGGAPCSATGQEVKWAIETLGVRGEHLHALCDGCAMDLESRTFADLEELEHYCSLVASAVGFACLGVFGVDESTGRHYADMLGKALQLTNILRDLRADAEIDRCYVPLDALERHGVERDWLLGTGPSEAYADEGPVHALVRDLSRAAHGRFSDAARALPDASSIRRRLVPAEIMGAVYASLLHRVDARRGRIDRPGRLRVPKPQKILLALRTWVCGRRP